LLRPKTHPGGKMTGRGDVHDRGHPEAACPLVWRGGASTSGWSAPPHPGNNPRVFSGGRVVDAKPRRGASPSSLTARKRVMGRVVEPLERRRCTNCGEFLPFSAFRPNLRL